MVRVSKKRVVKKKIFIFVEGETEQKYFEFLRQKLRLSNVKIKIGVLNSTGRTWIEKAKKVMKNDPNFKPDKSTEIFVIFDKDAVSFEEYNKMVKEAKKENIHLGFSNLMFEVWLLAHFEKISPRVLSKTSLMNKLSKYLSEPYKKANSNQLEKIIFHHEEAILNAESISQINFDRQVPTLERLLQH